MFRRVRNWFAKKRKKSGKNNGTQEATPGETDGAGEMTRTESVAQSMSVTTNTTGNDCIAVPEVVEQPARDPKQRASRAFVVDEDHIYSNSPALRPQVDRPPGAALSPRPASVASCDISTQHGHISGSFNEHVPPEIIAPAFLKPLEECGDDSHQESKGLNLACEQDQEDKERSPRPTSGSAFGSQLSVSTSEGNSLPPLKRVGSSAGSVSMLAASSSTKFGSHSLTRLPSLTEGSSSWFAEEEIGSSGGEDLSQLSGRSGPTSPVSPLDEDGGPRQLELEELEEMFAEEVFTEPEKDDPNKMSAAARRSVALAALNIPNTQLEPYVGTPTAGSGSFLGDEQMSPGGGTPVGSRSTTPLTPTLEVLYKRNTERRRSMSEGRSPRRPTIERRRASVVRDSEGKKHVNEYVILKPLGKGTYGKVKLCVKTDENALYAVKILNKSVLGRKRTVGFQTMLMDVEREIAIIKKLDHPNVVKLHEVINDPDQHKMYLIMEYVESGQLMTDDLAASRVNEEVARDYLRQIILGLEYLHYQKVIHRDLKPENLLLTEDGVVKIADFGVAHFYEGEDDTIRRSAGTPAFQAPEVVSGAEFQGAPSDVWSLGVTLWMMVFGSVPFNAPNEFLLYEMIREEPVVVPGGASPELTALLNHLLEKDPTKRITLAEMKSHAWITDNGELPVLPPLEEHCYTDIDSELTEGELSGAFGSTEKFALLVQTKLRMRRALSDARDRVRRASESSAAGSALGAGGPPAPPPHPSLALSLAPLPE